MKNKARKSETAKTPDWETVQRLRRLLEEQGCIVAIWTIEDVVEVRPDLNEIQCREVLKLCDRYHNAEIGLNWDLIRDCAEELFPE
jgi:hypothetical protein